ncbi:uncharacterized protein BDR25DRAFT_12114 [Lindgomyces ingoldianus]|uniref:Uncharacterized protein n=1 Tax=Lindgomyces ingoldianus TaxID=673940 RepID=A0ACB6R0V2_9PLEO|nr:uncharacterized protein BDR25DRAFT_12114 [Lindgomyces ingoldianus]KAF2472873.1 hypothetical protein BDR25DRAFT_12114 [Lindgomyces ingoldianus]
MAHQTFPVEPRTPWLAISFGCCASHRGSTEDDGAVLRAKGETEMRICYDQPQPVAQPRAEPIYARPNTSHSMSRHVSQWVISGREFATRASSRASIHTIHKPRTSHSKNRPSIGRPTEFRKTDGLDGFDGIQSMLDEAPMPIRRRRSFQPLELSIYLPDGRLSPLPDFSTVEWDKLPAELEIPAQALVRDRDSRTNSISSNPSTSSYLIQRKPVGSGSRRSSVQSQNSIQQSRPVSASLPFMVEESKSRPDSSISNPNALQRSSTHSSLASPRRITSRLSSPSRSRANTANSERGSLRKAKTDVDEAIRELNTIVEERRADAYRSNNQSPALINRPPPSPSHHVPLIAPSLRMRVRSETLSDIGSAFSVPLASKPLPTPPPPPMSNPLSRATTKLSLTPPSHTPTGGPLTSNPITPPTPTIPTPTTPIHRLGAWLKRSIPTTPTSPSFFKTSSSTSKSQTPPATTPSQAPFYQCTPSLPPSRGTATGTNNTTPASRPTTAGSRTVVHTRQDSNDTATVTLFSTSASGSYPSTPALSTRSNSPSPSHKSPYSPQSPETPATPARINLLKGEGKTRRVPAPLSLAKEKEMMVEVEVPLGSARSVASTRSGRSLKPPPSPNYALLRGMEIPVRTGGVGKRESALSASPVSPVGVAF